MGNSRATILSFLLAGILFATGCETRETKPASLPKQAMAPEAKNPKVESAQQQPKIPQPATPKPANDPADALIAQAEKLLAAGQANYAAGHLDAARGNFDQAFNLLLSSKLEVQGNERLEDEFSKVVEAVHDLELVALKQGDGFSEPKPEPAPIDEANDITFPVDPNIKAKAEGEIKTTKSDLPLVLNDEVAMFHQLLLQPQGKGDTGAGIGALRTLSGDDPVHAEGSWSAAGPHLPGAGGVWVPAAGAVASGRARHVAIYGQSRRYVRTGARLVGR